MLRKVKERFNPLDGLNRSFTFLRVFTFAALL
jgi:hypothetical protein